MFIDTAVKTSNLMWYISCGILNLVISILYLADLYYHNKVLNQWEQNSSSPRAMSPLFRTCKEFPVFPDVIRLISYNSLHRWWMGIYVAIYFLLIRVLYELSSSGDRRSSVSSVIEKRNLVKWTERIIIRYYEIFHKFFLNTEWKHLPWWRWNIERGKGTSS